MALALTVMVTRLGLAVVMTVAVSNEVDVMVLFSHTKLEVGEAGVMEGVLGGSG